MKRTKKMTAIILVCTLTLSTLLPVFASTPTADKKQAQKVSDELLNLMNVTYDDLADDNFVDDGTTYSCIIWINDIDKEVAVRAGIDAAEKTRGTYRASEKYEYPYTLEEVNGIKYVEVQFDENENDEYVQTYIEAERTAASELYENKNGNFVTENFKTRDAEVNYISSYTPCVFADLTISRIADLMNAEAVNRIGYWDEALPENANSRETSIFTSADKQDIDTHMEIISVNDAKSQYGLSGVGIKIGQYELACPNNSSVTIRTGYNGYNNTDNHATNVFTIMNKVAPRSAYYATGGNFKDSIEWLISQGVNIINLSCGWNDSSDLNNYDERSRWLDHVAYNHNVHVVKSAGNEDDQGVTSPGMAYNIVTVGNVRMESPYYKNNSSSYNNAGVSRNLSRTYKPDVMAPGTYRSGKNGTSYAAPLVTGTIALICEYRSSLKTKQRTVKAILASSVGETPGSYVTTQESFMYYGAGIIDAHAAMGVIINNQYRTDWVAGSLVGRSYDMVVTDTTVKRVALTYENHISISDASHEDANLSSSHLIAEIKLIIKAPDDSTIATCAVSGANLKVVEFTPPTIGTYTITARLMSDNTSNTATNIGVAWE